MRLFEIFLLSTELSVVSPKYLETVKVLYKPHRSQKTKKVRVSYSETPTPPHTHTHTQEDFVRINYLSKSL